MQEEYIEDLLLGIEERNRTDKSLILLIYDIPDNKKRTKFSKFMESYGKRVQKSAFEMILDNKAYKKLLSAIPNYINDEDNIRVYKLRIEGEITSWGSGMTVPQEVIII